MSFEIILLILHVFGAGLIIGISILALASVIKPPLTAKNLDRLGFIGRFGMWASTWQFITGALLYAREPSEFNHNVWFWIKIGLYVLEGTLSSMVIGRQVKRVSAAIAQNQPPLSRGLAATALTVALSVLLMASIGVVLVSSHGGT